MGVAHTYTVSPVEGERWGRLHSGGVSTLSKTYKRVMGGCAFASFAVMLMYVTVAAISVGDGTGVGIEMAGELQILFGVIMVLSGTIAAEAWLAHRAAKESIERDIKPLIRAEVERVSARNGAFIRQIIANEFAEAVDAAIQRAHRTGMIAQAQSAGNIGVARVVKMRVRDQED
jgi:hypothetical protein